MKCLWTYLTLQAFVSGLVSNVPVSHVWTVEGRQMCHWACWDRLSSRQRQTHMDTTSAFPSLYWIKNEWSKRLLGAGLSLGFFRIHWVMKWTNFSLNCPTGRTGGSSSTMHCSNWRGIRDPWFFWIWGYGNMPSANSMKEMPTLQTSAWIPYCSPDILSGAMYALVPTYVFAIEFTSCVLTPKSHSLTCPRVFTSILEGLTSLWSIFRLHKYVRPFTTATAIRPKTCSGIRL